MSLAPKLLIVSLVLGLSACGGQQPVQTQAPVQPTQAAKPQKPKITANQVLGASGPWLQEKMGAPDFSRQDMNAHIWQYKNKTCVLNMFLYEENGAFKVLHFDARDAQGANTDRAACLSALQN